MSGPQAEQEPRPRVLVVDDEASLAEFLEIFLKKEGFAATTTTSGEEAVELAQAGGPFELVLTDLMMPGVGGLEVLSRVKEISPDTEVVLMTAYATADTAIEAMQRGAYDYVQKPFKVDELRVVLDRALEARRLVLENRALRQRVAPNDGGPFARIVGRSPAIQEVLDVVRRVADTRTNVLITGESGTGKELLARALHDASGRREAPFVAVNCGAIPEALIESELFGHVKGAFTSAHTAKEGMFQAASGGTLFLDEVAELPVHLQVKLLRALQERRVRPVGSTAEAAVDVRVVAATNADLEQLVAEGTFREDLYYRLNVIRIQAPPLRERPEDIILIARRLLERFSQDTGKEIRDLDPTVIDVLVGYDFPGNVRELENVLERAVAFETTSRVTLPSLPREILDRSRRGDPLGAVARLPPDGLDLEALLAKIERRLLRQALERSGGNRTEAARLLRISFRAIRYKLDKYDLRDTPKRTS